MSSLAQPILTPQQYLEIERKAERRSEFVDGQMFLMSGASRKHVGIVRNASRRLDEQFEDGRCEVLTNDMRVRVDPGGPYYYPDLVVVCGEPEFEDVAFDTLLNPKIVIEVLSPSTEPYDRGKKFKMYRQIQSLAEYLLISQDQISVEHYVLQPNGEWSYKEISSLDAIIELPSVGAKLKAADIYRRVKLGS